MHDRQRLRNIIGGSAGNFVEWFDWFVYASFALYFSKAFFPGNDQTVQLLNSALVFGGAFVGEFGVARHPLEGHTGGVELVLDALLDGMHGRDVARCPRRPEPGLPSAACPTAPLNAPPT